VGRYYKTFILFTILVVLGSYAMISSGRMIKEAIGNLLLEVYEKMEKINISVTIDREALIGTSLFTFLIFLFVGALAAETDRGLTYFALSAIALITIVGSIPIFYPEVLHSEIINISYHFFILALVDYLFLVVTLALINSKIVSVINFITFLVFFLGSSSSGSALTALLDLVVYPILSLTLLAVDRASYKIFLPKFPQRMRSEASTEKEEIEENEALRELIKSEIEKIRDFMEELGS